MSEQDTAAQQDANAFTLKDFAEAEPQMFDRFEVFRQHVHPIVEQLIGACKEHRLAFNLVVAHTQDENGTSVASSQHLPSPGETTPEVLLAGAGARADHDELQAVIVAGALRAMKAMSKRGTTH